MNQTSSSFHTEEISPLHTLEKQLVRSSSLRKSRPPSTTTSSSTSTPTSITPANAIPEINDHESIYSFESVSTNGRLLDRLELSEGEEEEDFEFNDNATIMSTGRLLDRLQLSRGLSQRPIKTVERNIKHSIGNLPPSQRASQQAFVTQHIRHVPMNLVFQNTNNSVETIESNIASLNKTETNSSGSIQPQTSTESSQETPNISPSSDSSDKTLPMVSPTEGLFPKTDSLSSEERIALAQELRKFGKHREASYQLQIAANEPYYNTKAMYHYSMALHFGQGVKQNDRHALNWLCRCLLMSFPHINPSNATMIAQKLSTLTCEELIRLIMKNLQVTMNKDEHLNGNDPIMLYPIFQTLTKNQINKIIHICKNKLDITSVAYHELGNFLINGWGLEHKDEMAGIACLSKAGSMGNIDSMVQLGDIWCNKTKYHKKDLCKAAGWLRLSELFGIKSIGNSWIYKEKYMGI